MKKILSTPEVSRHEIAANVEIDNPVASMYINELGFAATKFLGNVENTGVNGFEINRPIALALTETKKLVTRRFKLPAGEQSLVDQLAVDLADAKRAIVNYSYNQITGVVEYTLQECNAVSQPAELRPVDQAM